MKRFKANFMAVAAVLVAAGTMAFSAPASLQSGWYQVSGGAIGNATSGPSGDCNTLNRKTLCMVQLQLDPNEPVPETVTEAEANGQISSRAFRPF